MADWSGVKTDPSQINGGKEYEAQKDRVSIEAFNAIVNNAIYAEKASSEALEKANSAFQGNGTIVRVGGESKGYVDFDSDPQEQLNSKESFVLMYDMNSPYESINLGYTSGIYNGTTIGLNSTVVSKYKYLRFYVENCGIIECPVGQTAKQLTQAYNLGSAGNQYVYGVRINVTPNDFTFTSFNAQGTADVEGIEWIKCYKIEGVR